MMCFVSQRQCIQPKDKTDGIRNFMHTKHSGQNLRSKMFLFISQGQWLTAWKVSYIIRTTEATRNQEYLIHAAKATHKT